MKKIPPIVLECPECGEKYLVSQNANEPSEDATIFSDGFFTDKSNWKTPEIIGCVTCELGFLAKTGKLIAKPSWDEFCDTWSHLKKAEPPTAGALVLELRARKNMDINEEKVLRKELWYSGLHSETGKTLLYKNKKFKAFWENNLLAYEKLLSANKPNELLLKAEINRQLEQFEQCINLLKTQNNSTVSQIRKKATEKISSVFVIE